MNGHADRRCLRLALLGTPRSGNTWLRLLLATAYGCESLASHSPAEVPWEMLPDDLVLQMHQHRDPSLAAQLGDSGFGVIAVARHPLDVLVSILHYAQNDPSPARWLDGEGGDELRLAEADPLSEAFLGYATGARARALIGVTREWWAAPGALRVRYEDLVADPARELAALVEAIGVPARRPLEEAVEANALARLRPTATNQHFWQGHPGNWRKLLPKRVARAIADAHAGSFESLGYECDPDPGLREAKAAENWARIARRTGERPADFHAAVRRTDSDRIRHLLAERYLLIARAHELEETVRSARYELSRLADENEALAGEVARVRASGEEMACEFGSQRDALEALRTEIAWRTAVSERLEAEVEWRRTVTERLESDVEWRKTVTERQKRDLEWLRSGHASKDAALASLLSSRSLRYTAPLRSLVRFVSSRR